MQFHSDDCPFDTSSDPEKTGVDLFAEYFWHSSEVCNGCFARIRDVGPRVTRQLEEPKHAKHMKDGPALTLEVNAWFSRTEGSSQEHTSFDHNRRFGTCFCLSCGADCTGNHRHKTLLELKPLAQNIVAFTRDHTPFSIDAERFARELADLKRVPEHQGYETEMLAIAWARSRTDSR